MTHYTTLTQPLWLTIIKDYIDPYDYLQLSLTQQSFRHYLLNPLITNYLSQYIKKQLHPYQVESEELDHRDDCGTSCLVYFLNNGQILDSEEYQYIYQEQLDIYRYHFPWLSL